MGCTSFKEKKRNPLARAADLTKKISADFDGVVERAAGRSCQAFVAGRYHRLPHRFEDDYILQKQILGTGYSGSVRKAKCRLTKKAFAVKAFVLNELPTKKIRELKAEAEIFLSMDHPHVARLVDVYETDVHLRLVMECMEGGELFDRVVAQKRLLEKDASDALKQMLLAVNYIHSRGIVHRDLKLENFLYATHNSDDLKLIDFGFSHFWDPNTHMSASCGTLSYVAPEVLNQSYTSQCDLWSLGVIAFILLLGYMPFRGSEDVQIGKIRAGDWFKDPAKWKKLSHPAQEFLSQLLVVNPRRRLSAPVALKHSFITRTATGQTLPNPEIDQETFDALREYGQASRFRRICLSLMAWSLSNEERAQVSETFMALDENQRGTITYAEWEKAVAGDRFVVTNEQVKPIFDALDTCHNNEIHFSEFLAAMVSTRIKLSDNLLRTTFRRFDCDGTGFITVDNLKSVLGESFEGTTMDIIIKEADFTHDGRISYDEFMRFCHGDTCRIEKRNSERSVGTGETSNPRRSDRCGNEGCCCFSGLLPNGSWR